MEYGSYRDNTSPLEDNPTQIHREQEKEGIYASMLTNLPENSEIDLKVGEYFDLVHSVRGKR